MTTGLLFDSYPIGSTMVSWIKDGRGMTRIEDDWTPSIYVASDDRKNLERLARNGKVLQYISSDEIVERVERVTDAARSNVLRLRLRDSHSILDLARTVESLHGYGRYRLYNVDVPPAQSYFYEYDIFPFGRFARKNGWVQEDDVESTDYEIPALRMAYVSVVPRKQSRLARPSDRIDSIIINGEIIRSGDETEIMLQLVSDIRRQDPDLVITSGGDSFDLPYLVHRASENGISHRLVLGREVVPLQRPRRKGTSYFSYGRMYFKPSAVMLFGRIHIDTSSCFIWGGPEDLHGLYEIARVCRMPLQTASRASIGRCMSSLQFYNAERRGLLVPWKPVMAEAFKPRSELLVGDRGGLIFEPEAGAYENVAELDFASLYGSIMEKKNISAETILCPCCQDSENRVPELGYNICRRKGIVPQSLGILLKKRRMYTELLAGPHGERSSVYEARKSALKWILVTSFGYLGFNNAKFGRIDAHMAVCAFARRILLQAVRIAEERGFRVLHGIVDSLWLHRKGATRDEYGHVRDEIVRATGFEMSLEVYRWLVFLPSREDVMVPVANKYFGAFEDGRMKIRGIEARRHDTPEFLRRCQLEVLGMMARAGSISEVRDVMPQALSIYEKYKGDLEGGAVPADELAFTTRASKDVCSYRVNSVQRDAMLQMHAEGDDVRAGQKVRYVITDYSRRTRRTAPLQMAGAGYDVRRYVRMLAECCNTVTRPFGTEIKA
ncbi:MAG: hypothetical protein KGI33_05010 [Thaumarchaeota archaeon]|nr:hypothetical protein [Nitrososphaerota archaeon]